ncbi:metallophosphoesterase family protein [Legionella tunisiensis]|uniref:metallophosphoesterase family protein n=1 Tax=Legionella tunisiensis TaxID=1034944 RepID=UPI0002F39435|nr:metallophosphoesterase [Legionella tunisiensis]
MFLLYERHYEHCLAYRYSFKFLDSNARHLFYKALIHSGADRIIISGDIAEAPTVNSVLLEMRDVLAKPIYFVLGNHDYYHGRIANVRAQMQHLTNQEPLLFWLAAAGPLLLEKDIYLLGQDGWADGRFGDYYSSSIIMNDSRMIEDLFQKNCLGKTELLVKMQELADNDAQQLKENLRAAITKHAERMIIVTHVPPFQESTLLGEKRNTIDFLPFYTSKATGQVLITIAEEYTQLDFLVLCGHIHSKTNYQPRHNLTVKTGQAEYYNPAIQTIFIL